VDKTLQRLAQSGDLSRIGRSLYYQARQSSLTGKPTHPDQKAVIDAIVRHDQTHVVVDSLTAANDLGLTTAVPARVRVMIDARLRPIRLGNQTIEFQTVAPSRLYWAGRNAMRVVQALYWAQNLLRSNPQPILKRLKALLKDPPGAADPAGSAAGHPYPADLDARICTVPYPGAARFNGPPSVPRSCRRKVR
jgi:hypothetical protein